MLQLMLNANWHNTAGNDLIYVEWDIKPELNQSYNSLGLVPLLDV